MTTNPRLVATDCLDAVKRAEAVKVLVVKAFMVKARERGGVLEWRATATRDRARSAVDHVVSYTGGNISGIRSVGPRIMYRCPRDPYVVSYT